MEKTICFTAIDKMRQKNMEKYGEILGKTIIGPVQPAYEKKAEDSLSLKAAAIQFIHESCVELRFNAEIEKEEVITSQYQGKSGPSGRIPYNMQMDIDRLTLEKAIERFADSGASQDAFDVYFCYMEMFVGAYGKCNRMIELLSEFENNGSSLLMKHRDHYSHSVYVFILGLAIYETNSLFRSAYEKYYENKLVKGQTAAHHFLQYWGLASLFHDIGYPFELPFEQVESYFEERGQWEDRESVSRENFPFIAYKGLDSYVNLDADTQKMLKEILHYKLENPEKMPAKTTDELFAYELANKLSKYYHFTKESMLVTLKTKPANPDRYGYFMDHAYFSATVLFRELNESKSEQYPMTSSHIDALTAIILHNSLYKFSVAYFKDEKLNKPFAMELHPLAYMLMLCDELQCWDRTSYGRNSRTQLHPMDCEFVFKNNGIWATYIYDIKEQKKVQDFETNYEKFKEGEITKKPKLKAYGEMVYDNDFQADIESIVALNTEGTIGLNVTVDLKAANRAKKRTYLSDSNFLHLYNFAVALNAQYANLEDDIEEAEKSFDALSLEYKISNVLQAKKFAEYLNDIGCFYTDRAVDFDMKDVFTEEELVKIGIKEHDRWDDEKKAMSWLIADEEVKQLYTPAVGDSDEKKKNKKSIREQLRMSHLIDMAFETLPLEEQIKDQKPLNTMMKKLQEFDGLRVYKL